MPKLKLNIPHQLTKEEATKRLGQFIEMLQTKYQGQVSDLHQSWIGDALDFGFSTMGASISGKLRVEDSQLALDGEIPFRAMMFKGKIESAIKDELGKLMS